MTHPFQAHEPAARALLARMTLAEKIGQLNLVTSRSDSRERNLALARSGRIGARILAANAYAGTTEQVTLSVRDLNAVQRAAVEDSRLGIPILSGRDVIHGHRTIFPMPIAQAAGWNPDRIEEMGRMAAQEARAQGTHWTYAPMIDIARDPRWGRIVESFGEDPHLSGRCGAAAVRGYQGEPAAVIAGDRVLACGKHFIGYGAVLAGRDYQETEISEQTLLNVHAPPFAAAIRAGLWTVMSAFTSLDGEPVSGSARLLRGLLRERLGFPGFVVSDYGSVPEMVAHGRCGDARAAAHLALEAGLDMDMCGGAFAEHLEQLVAAGALDEARVDDAVLRVLLTKFGVGLFEQPYIDEARAAGVRPTPAGRELARVAAAEGAVLLKNEGVLPLARGSGRTFAVVGPLIDDARIHLGCWKSDGRVEESGSIAVAFRALAPDERLVFARDTEDVVRTASRADVVIVCVGEGASRTGEDNSVADPRLPAGQEELIRSVAQLGRPVVVVVVAARPLVLTSWARDAAAILLLWHGGMEAANALAEMIFGAREPGGRLPVTLPVHVGQCPMSAAPRSYGRPIPGTGAWRDVPTDPLYAFGHGLGYTTFAVTRVELARAEMSRGEATELQVAVANTGKRPGATVLQLYVRDLVAERVRPVRELRGFRRVELAPGDETTIHFPVGSDELGYFGPDGAWTVEPGEFRLAVGFDATVAGDLALRVTG